MNGWLRTRGALSDITPRYGLLLDDPHLTAPTNCRYEACIALPEDLGPLPWGFSVKRLPYGAYARTRHVGGNDEIAQTISTIRSEWTSNTGLVWDTVRPVIEIYLDTPSKLPVDHQRIDVCLPVMFLRTRRP
jgi:AraC family transcriptional regulator